MTGPAAERRAVLLDNRDSFVHTVARYLRELGARTTVLRSDRATLEELERTGLTHLVVSPGPCTPTEAGVSVEAVRAWGPKAPVLGICLGHQCVAAAYGGRVVPAKEPMHGRSSRIHHRGEGILADFPNPAEATRYHSLAVGRDGLPSTLTVEAETEDGEIMALRHRTLPVWGVQFHPESVLTRGGRNLLGAFLDLQGPSREGGSGA